MAAFWQIFDGKNGSEAIVTIMKKNLTSQSKVDSIRGLIGTDWQEY